MEAKEDKTDPVLKALQRRHERSRDKLPERTQLSQDAPAPKVNGMIADHGSNAFLGALGAWEERVAGRAIIDIATGRGLSLMGAKLLIKEAHNAIAEDLKEALDLNRQLDLSRIDGLLQTYYPQARAGDQQAANVTLKCLERRAKLTGAEPESVPGRSHPENVLVWIQAQMPSITKLVDSLPPELPPGAPL